MKLKDLDPVELIKKEKKDKKKPEKGVKAFFVSKYDPRMPHPRKMISHNYHHSVIKSVPTGEPHWWHKERQESV